MRCGTVQTQTISALNNRTVAMADRAALARAPGLGGRDGLDLASIRAALAAADHGSLRRAARVIGLGEPALSQRIRTLEDALSVSLFHRSPQGVRPTHAGESFLALAREALDCLEIGAAKAAAAGRGAQGRLSLGPASSFSAGRLNRALTRYRAAHPSVDLQLVEGARSQMIEGLHRRTVDVAVLVGDPDPAIGEPLPLWCERVYAALPYDHVLAPRKCVSWDDLQAEPFLATLQGGGADGVRLAGAPPSGSGKARLIQSYPVSLEPLLSMVGLGLGVSLITESDLERRPDTVAGVPLTEGGGAVSVPLIAYRDPRNDNPSMRRFWSLLKGRYSPGRPALRSPAEG